MGFALDGHSQGILKPVHPHLIKLVQDCAEHFSAPFTFGVNEGVRSPDQQKLDVLHGKSLTTHSRHLDGHAVDLVVLQQPGNKITWAWPLYYTLADQMRLASIRTGIPVIWGGCWDKDLASLSEDMEVEAALYVTRARARGQRGFLDGPHYEIPKDRYPSL